MHTHIVRRADSIRMLATCPSPARCDAIQRGSASRPVSDSPSGWAACSTFLRTVSRRFAPPDPAVSRGSRIDHDDEAVMARYVGARPLRGGPLLSVLLPVAGSLCCDRVRLGAPRNCGVRRRFALLTVRRAVLDARRRAPAASRSWAPDPVDGEAVVRIAHARCRPSIPHDRLAAVVPSAPAWAGATRFRVIDANDKRFRLLPIGKSLSRFAARVIA